MEKQAAAAEIRNELKCGETSLLERLAQGARERRLSRFQASAGHLDTRVRVIDMPEHEQRRTAGDIGHGLLNDLLAHRNLPGMQTFVVTTPIGRMVICSHVISIRFCFDTVLRSCWR